MRSELDLDAALWTIPAERMKGDAAHLVPLSAPALIRSLPEFTGSHLFSTTAGRKPVNGFSKAKARLDYLMLAELRKDAAERGEDPGKAQLAPWVLHDLRRTGRTRLSALPIPDIVRELVIAHAQKGLHKVYDLHSYLDEKRDALDRWAWKLRDIVDPPPSNVTVLRASVTA